MHKAVEIAEQALTDTLPIHSARQDRTGDRLGAGHPIDAGRQ